MAPYIYFSDESHFSLCFLCVNSSGWNVSQGAIAFVLGSVRFGGGEVIVYAGISIDGRIDLHIIRNRALNGHRYRDEILKLIVVLYTAELGDEVVLMDDIGRFGEGIMRMKWPACSPDMNPIQHVWDIVGR
ncbi:transposable element Tcb2 transposase [Trichonephila clavipes]|nr:transposable element Tcb2 transposase [Trichonephila clavipes]